MGPAREEEYRRPVDQLETIDKAVDPAPPAESVQDGPDRGDQTSEAMDEPTVSIKQMQRREQQAQRPHPTSADGENEWRSTSQVGSKARNRKLTTSQQQGGRACIEGDWVGSVWVDGRERTPTGCEIDRELSTLGSEDTALQLHALADTFKDFYHNPGARFGFNLYRSTSRIFSTGAGGLQAILTALLNAEATVDAIQDEALQQQARSTYARCQRRLVEVGLFRIVGSSHVPFDEDAIILRLYALVVMGVSSGVIEVKWLDADCAYGLLAGLRADIGGLNCRTELEQALLLPVGTGPGGERTLSREARLSFRAMLDDDRCHPDRVSRRHFIIDYSHSARMGDAASSSQQTPVDHTVTYTIDEFSWSGLMALKSGTEATRQRARDGQIGAMVGDFVRRSILVNRLMVRSRVSEAEALELSVQRVVGGFEQLVDAVAPVLQRHPMAIVDEPPRGAGCVVVCRDFSSGRRAPSLGELQLVKAVEVAKLASALELSAEEEPALVDVSAPSLCSLKEAWALVHGVERWQRIAIEAIERQSKRLKRAVVVPVTLENLDLPRQIEAQLQSDAEEVRGPIV